MIMLKFSLFDEDYEKIYEMMQKTPFGQTNKNPFENCNTFPHSLKILKQYLCIYLFYNNLLTIKSTCIIARLKSYQY